MHKKGDDETPFILIQYDWPRESEPPPSFFRACTCNITPAFRHWFCYTKRAMMRQSKS